jgi:UPF0755 protein
MNIKKHKKILALFLVIALIVFLISLYLLISYIPSFAEEIYGKPAPTLETSQRIILSMQLIIKRKALFNTDEMNISQQTFQIEPGESAGSVADRLEKLKFIPDAQSVVNYWQYKSQDRLIQPGVYLIQPGWSPIMIAQGLVNNNPEFIRFAFLPGWRKEEIENLLINSLIFPADYKIIDFEKTILDRCFPLGLKDLKSIEGFLFPGEYQIPIGFSPEEILCSFSEQFFNVLPDNFEDLVNANGLSVYEAVILASIVEKEKILESEAPIIASVFINRLNMDMPLQSDPTIQYALPESTTLNEWWKNPLESSDLIIVSPYNTYLNKGLPPTPISNPGLSSLLAVVYPEKTPYLYFRASCDGTGSHVFSETYQQHLDAACY